MTRFPTIGSKRSRIYLSGMGSVSAPRVLKTRKVESSRRGRLSGDAIRVASFPPAIKQNPYQQLFYRSLARFGFELEEGNRFKLAWLVRRRRSVEILHFHWIQGYYTLDDAGGPVAASALSWLRLCLFGTRLLVARLLRYRVAWTIHQVYPHETRSLRLDRAGSLLVGWASSVLMAHDERTAREAESALHLPRGRVAIVPHGSYIGVYPEGRTRETVRRQLKLQEDAFVFLSFGHLRGYKDVDLLLESFRSTQGSLPTAFLVIAGMPVEEGCVAAIDKAAAEDDRIRPLLEFIPDERVTELFHAADTAVFARGDGGTSGALILALSCGVPVIAASIDSYAEVVGNNGCARLFPPADGQALTTQLESAAREGKEGASERGRAALQRARALSWDNAGSAAARLFREACA